MANVQLSKNFLFGSNNSPIYMPATPEYDFFIGIPERQKKLVKLAQAQVVAQNETAKSIELSNSKIANEIKQFSVELGGEISKLSSNVSQIGDNIVNSISSLEYSIVCEFRELRWILSQVGEKLDQIIILLKNKRKFEANELLEQSLSNLKNGYYQEAKDRLLKAIEFDNTDYQIHRNLGFVFLHDNNADKAIEHFQKSVAFSPNNIWKIDALSDLSRTYYAINNYSKALEYLDELKDILNLKQDILNKYDLARFFYNYSVYSALNGDIETCLKNLDQAIQLKRSYFVLATIDKDYDKIRNYINKFLNDKVTLASQEAESNCSSLFILAEDLNKDVKHNESSFLNDVNKNINIIKLKLGTASYTDLIDIKKNSLILSNILKLIINEKEIQEDLKTVKDDLSKEERRLNEFYEKEQNKIKRLETKEIKSAKSRKTRANFFRVIFVIISFCVLAALGSLLVSSSWVGCEEYSKAHNTKGIGDALGKIISMILWAVFNLAIVPASLVALFLIPTKISASMKEYASKVGIPNKINYKRPAEHVDLITMVADKGSKVSNLSQKINGLKTKIIDSQSKIYWTVK